MRRSLFLLWGLASLAASYQAPVETPLVKEPIAGSNQLGGAADLGKVREWLSAVQKHQPGQIDEGLMAVAKWPSASLAVTITDAVELLRLSAALPTLVGKAGPRVTYRGHAFRVEMPPPPMKVEPAENLNDTLEIKDGDVSHGLINRLLERGTLLQTDLAIYVTAGGRANTGPPVSRGDVTFHVADGEVTDLEDASPYWRDARFVVEAIDRRPQRNSDPRGEPLVSLWYRAMSAYAASLGRWSDTEPLLSRGLALFPDDERLLFDMGALHEAYADNGNQHAAESLIRAGDATTVRHETAELQTAREQLEAAIAHDENLAEARLHLGRVLARLGDHQAALRELARAEEELHDPELKYDAALFLAHEQNMTGHRDAARESYLRAADRFPDAPSPKFGLSDLARLDEDGPTAIATLTPGLAGAGSSDLRADPFWDYLASHSRDASALMALMRRAFMKGGDQ